MSDNIKRCQGSFFPLALKTWLDFEQLMESNLCCSLENSQTVRTLNVCPLSSAEHQYVNRSITFRALD